VGEVVFNTGMTGYQEVLTDPSYCGQIVLFTYPELGNTGVNAEDEESSHPQVWGAIARNVTWRPSNWRASQSLPDYLIQHQIPAIYGVDTRALVRKIRLDGAMNGAISTEILDATELLAEVRAAPRMLGSNLVPKVSTPTPYEWSQTTNPAWEYLLGRTLGGETFKLKFGHRGLNQPAGLNQRFEITSQNHSFALSPNSLDPATVEVTHFNLNDQTIAGLKHRSLPLFSVQYHPEASPGPHDADYLFEQFIAAMRDHHQSRVS